MNKSLPWQPTDQTLRTEVACLNFAPTLHSYAAGFRKGAEALLEVVNSTGYDQDLLVYPIVYSLRHAVELLLKQVTLTGRSLLDEQGDFDDNHRLDSLWHTCKPLLKHIWPNDPSYKVVETTISRLCHLDPAGEAFRYPISAKRKTGREPTLDSSIRQLDLAALVRDVVEVIDLLDGADTGIDAYLESNRDMLEEHRQIEREIQASYETDEHPH